MASCHFREDAPAALVHGGFTARLRVRLIFQENKTSEFATTTYLYHGFPTRAANIF
jgi:hypothetical protein